MDRAYEDDNTLDLGEARGFRTVVPPKKNRQYAWLYDKQLHKKRNNIARYFLCLKCFRKIFTRYDKLDSIFIYTISFAFIFDLIFMWTLSRQKSFI